MSRQSSATVYAGLRPEIARYALGALLSLTALNAFGGGYHGLTGARGVPEGWLTASPFQSYFLPSLFLFVVVGGSFLLATLAVFRRWSLDWVAALAAGVVVLAWMAAQLAFIGFVSWWQPATALVGLVIVRLSLVLGR